MLKHLFDIAALVLKTTWKLVVCRFLRPLSNLCQLSFFNRVPLYPATTIAFPFPSPPPTSCARRKIFCSSGSSSSRPSAVRDIHTCTRRGGGPSLPDSYEICICHLSFHYVTCLWKMRDEFHKKWEIEKWVSSRREYSLTSEENEAAHLVYSSSKSIGCGV